MDGQTERSAPLDFAGTATNGSAQPFNTAGKLKNFPYDAAAVKSQKAALELTID